MSVRDEVAELCRQHDGFMAEHASKPIRRPPASESDNDEIIYKDFDNSAQAALPVPEPEPFDEAQSEVLARVVAMLQDGEQAEREKALAPLKQEAAELHRQLAELRGQVSTLTTLFGQERPSKSIFPKSGDSSGVVELPNWRNKDVA